jgi:para-nitrobenzyl esterase
LGATEPEDYTGELTVTEDPTLESAHLDVEADVKAVVDHWGGGSMVNLLDRVYGLDRWDASDAPLSIVHGTDDPTVTYRNVEELEAIYQATGAYYELYRLDGADHGAWGVKYEGKMLTELAFDFLVPVLELTME